MMEKKLAIRPGQADVVDHLGHRRVAERLDQRVARCAHGLGPAGAGGEEQDGRGGDQQHAHRGDDPFGHIAFGLLGLLGGQRDAFDGQEEPDRERHRGPDAEVRRTAGTTTRRRRRWVRCRSDSRASKLPIAETAKISRPASAMAVMTNMTLSASPTPLRWMPMNSTYTARYTHQPSVMPNRPKRFDVGADECGDRGRRDRVLDQNRGAGGEPAPGSQVRGVRTCSRRRRPVAPRTSRPYPAPSPDTCRRSPHRR